MDAVFKALADEGRRALLDALREQDGLTVGDLANVLPAMTRFGVMKHLAVLEDANLLTTVRDGRAKRHYLNPVPIQQIQERWIAAYAQPHITALTRLKSASEGNSA